MEPSAGEKTVDNCGYMYYISSLVNEAIAAVGDAVRRDRELSFWTIRANNFYAGVVDPDGLSPRVKMALRLYAHGQVKTLIQAAEAVELHPRYLQNISRTQAGKRFMKTADEMIANTALSTTQLIDQLSRRAIEVIGTQMENASSESLRLKAAIDLADRGSETSKIQKHQVEAFTLNSADARAIAESMVEAAALRAKHAALATENFDRVNTTADEDDVPVVIPSPILRLEKP